MIRKWLEGTGKVKVNYPTREWIHGAVILMPDGCKATNCCMPVFEGPLGYIRYLKGLQERRLDQEQIERIAILLANPVVAKYFIDKQVKEKLDEVKKTKVQVGCSIDDNSKEENSVVKEDCPVITEGKSKNGKAFVRITGTREQAERVRDQYLKDGKNPG